MATTTCTGNLVCADGTNIPLKAEIAEGTESNLTTNTVYTVTAANVGDFADFAPGKTVIGGLVSSTNGPQSRTRRGDHPVVRGRCRH